MSEFDPELKRLFEWSRLVPPPRGEEVPFGFAGRVVARRRPVSGPTLLLELHQVAWGFTCVSVALIIFGVVVLEKQGSAPQPASEFSSALSFLASNSTQ